MSYRPYPNPDRALRQLARHTPPEPLTIPALAPLGEALAQAKASIRLGFPASDFKAARIGFPAAEVGASWSRALRGASPRLDETLLGRLTVNASREQARGDHA